MQKEAVALRLPRIRLQLPGTHDVTCIWRHGLRPEPWTHAWLSIHIGFRSVFSCGVFEAFVRKPCRPKACKSPEGPAFMFLVARGGGFSFSNLLDMCQPGIWKGALRKKSRLRWDANGLPIGLQACKVLNLGFSSTPMSS